MTLTAGEAANSVIHALLAMSGFTLLSTTHYRAMSSDPMPAGRGTTALAFSHGSEPARLDRPLRRLLVTTTVQSPSSPSSSLTASRPEPILPFFETMIISSSLGLYLPPNGLQKSKLLSDGAGLGVNGAVSSPEGSTRGGVYVNPLLRGLNSPTPAKTPLRRRSIRRGELGRWGTDRAGRMYEAMGVTERELLDDA